MARNKKNRKATQKKNQTNSTLTANRKYKDTVFRMLFSDRVNLSGEPRLELKVITLNINEGHNKELMEQCQTLREYAQYVAKVRKYTGEMSLDAAVERAVNECIQEGILEDFLRANRNEVIAMSIFEYNKDEEEKKLRKAEYEAGREEGKQEILKRMMDTGKYSLEEIAEVFHISIDELERIQKL